MAVPFTLVSVDLAQYSAACATPKISRTSTCRRSRSCRARYTEPPIKSTTLLRESDQPNDALIRASPSSVSGSILRRWCPPDETRFEKIRRT